MRGVDWILGICEVLLDPLNPVGVATAIHQLTVPSIAGRRRVSTQLLGLHPARSGP